VLAKLNGELKKVLQHPELGGAGEIGVESRGTTPGGGGVHATELKWRKKVIVEGNIKPE
jgi:hypothetical protein